MGSIVAEIADKIASAGGGERSELEVRGGIGAAGGGILTLSTSELTVVDGDILGRIDFQAPLETGTDAIVVSASIYAEADDTFAADNNSTELVFAVGASEAAAEKMRLTHDGELGIGIATPASKLHVEGTVQVGVDDAGFDFTLFGHAAGAALIWDASEDALLVRGATADAASTSAGRLVLQTAQVAVVDGDILGRIDFQAPIETQDTDARIVSASIFAEADGTFAADVNACELVFSTSASELPVERMRIASDGKVGIGTATPAQTLDVLGTISSNTQIRRGFPENSSGIAGDTWAGAFQQTSNASGAGGIVIGTKHTASYGLLIGQHDTTFNHLAVKGNGNVGLGLTGTTHLLHLVADDGFKPNGGSWGDTSDQRLKEDIEVANLSTCYDTIKNLPLKYYRWKDNARSDSDLKGDRHVLGWIAQDVKKVFPKSVSEIEFNGVSNEDGVQEVKWAEGDTLPAGKSVGDIRVDAVEETFKMKLDDCLTLNETQVMRMLYGAVQQLMAKVETLEDA